MAQSETTVGPNQTETASEAASDDAAPTGQSVRWTASEFVAHDKSAGWYIMIMGGALLLAAFIFLVTRDAVSTGVVVVAGLLLSVYGSHKPRQLEYTIDGRGVTLGGKYHSYDEFRSFAIASEEAFSSLVFMPLKRFAVPLTIYYPPEEEEKILAILADRIPLEEHRMDAVDNLLRRIRF